MDCLAADTMPVGPAMPCCLIVAPAGTVPVKVLFRSHSNLKCAQHEIQPGWSARPRSPRQTVPGSQPPLAPQVFFDPHLTSVMPFADIVDFSEFTEYIDPQELQAQQANAVDVIQVLRIGT